MFPFTLALFMVFITYRFSDRMCLSVYFKDHGNCAPSPWHYSRCSLHTGISMECVRWYILETMGIVPLHPDIVNGVHYIWVYWQNVFNDIFQRLWELCPYNLALFTVFITYRYIDRMCLSVYSRDHGNYSLLNAIIFNDVLTVHFFS
jgi:hypothetical protein